MKYEEMLAYWDKPTDGLTETKKARIEIIKERFKESDMSRYDLKGIYDAVMLVHDIHTLFDDFVYDGDSCFSDDDELIPSKGVSIDKSIRTANIELNNIVKGLQTRSMSSIPYTIPGNIYISKNERNYLRCV